MVPRTSLPPLPGGEGCTRLTAERLFLTHNSAPIVEGKMCLGIPGQIEAFVDEVNHIARVNVSGVRRNVNVALVRQDGIAPGDWVLIHVGFAMSKIDETEARETLNLLRQMGETYTDELRMLRESQIE